MAPRSTRSSPAGPAPQDGAQEPRDPPGSSPQFLHERPAPDHSRPSSPVQVNQIVMTEAMLENLLRRASAPPDHHRPTYMPFFGLIAKDSAVDKNGRRDRAGSFWPFYPADLRKKTSLDSGSRRDEPLPRLFNRSTLYPDLEEAVELEAISPRVRRAAPKGPGEPTSGLERSVHPSSCRNRSAPKEGLNRTELDKRAKNAGLVLEAALQGV
ncbi:hypothetical protein XA68_13705 [Ophiocordyceps unilateralis]|uniref:Uncharacterized protein n=1 Tax=Ophiocordyceps unilateralis TaxID=268505 RepID=A0A2A9PAJ5_OPHUN|nr:hypothetical protein XA68_13705 [Ophiocordyceps unilateralis]